MAISGILLTIYGHAKKTMLQARVVMLQPGVGNATSKGGFKIIGTCGII